MSDVSQLYSVLWRCMIACCL